MNICLIGTGYVGLVTGTCLAESGNNVICMDVDHEKISMLNEGRVPIYEPGLSELIRRNLQDDRLRFSTDLAQSIADSLIIFIAVGTPTGADGVPDVTSVLEVARSIAETMNGYRIIVTKSTVPVGTADRLRQIVSSLTDFEFDIVSNPEFLKEGAAVEDFMKPDRVVIGADNPRGVETMRELYAPFTRTGAPILVMDTKSSEMTKYAANAMLATRISFMNEIANLCEHLGADVDNIRRGIGTDRRIGSSFLFPGVGYGGSCFPKDIKALIHMAAQNNCPLKLMGAVEDVNRLQKDVIIGKILSFYASQPDHTHDQPKPVAALSDAAGHELMSRSEKAIGTRDDRHGLAVYGPESRTMSFQSGDENLQSLSLAEVEQRYGGRNPVQGKTLAIWGLSFKPQTDDMREAPSRVIIEQLLRLGCRIQAYDPEAMNEARRIFSDRISYARNNYQALENADALVVLTEWNVFRNPDFRKVRRLLKHPVIFDGRNQYEPREMRDHGFLYFCIGRS